MTYKKSIKIVAIVVFNIILAMTLHIMASKYSTIPQNANWSFLVEKLSLPGTLIIWYVVAFASIAFMFNYFKDDIRGNRLEKGLRYGIGIGILWLWGMCEGVALFGNPFMDEFITGACDAIPIVIMGIMLSIFISENSKKSIIREKISKDKSILNILKYLIVFTGVFSTGRYLFYYTEILNSGYKSHPYFTLIWTIIMGITVGITYLLLGKTSESKSYMINAVFFGVFIFGVNWSAFIIFIPFIFKGALINALIRIIIDVLLVTISCHLVQVMNPVKI